jgi:hypothetical protein
MPIALTDLVGTCISPQQSIPGLVKLGILVLLVLGFLIYRKISKAQTTIDRWNQTLPDFGTQFILLGLSFCAALVSFSQVPPFCTIEQFLNRTDAATGSFLACSLVSGGIVLMLAGSFVTRQLLPSIEIRGSRIARLRPNYERLGLIAFFGNYFVNNVVAGIASLVPTSQSAANPYLTAQYLTSAVLALIVLGALAYWYLMRMSRPGALMQGLIFGVVGFVVAVVTALVTGICSVLLQTGSLSQVKATLPNFGPYLVSPTTLILFGLWVVPGVTAGALIKFGSSATIRSLLDRWRQARAERKALAEQRAKERAAAAKAAWEESVEGRSAAARTKRLQEVEELKAKLLNPPPERMAAAIKIWEKDYEEIRPTMTDDMTDINSGHKPFTVICTSCLASKSVSSL